MNAACEIFAGKGRREDGLRNYLNIALNEKAAGREFPFICLIKKKTLMQAVQDL
jgi:hypothetical protein